MRKVVAVMMTALSLAACGAPASISGSNVKSVTVVARPDAIEVADGATRASAAAALSRHSVAPVRHPADRVPPTPVVRPAASPPSADPDRAMPGLSCQGYGGPGRLQPMCVPQ